MHEMVGQCASPCPLIIVPKGQATNRLFGDWWIAGRPGGSEPRMVAGSFHLHAQRLLDTVPCVLTTTLFGAVTLESIHQRGAPAIGCRHLLSLSSARQQLLARQRRTMNGPKFKVSATVQCVLKSMGHCISRFPPGTVDGRCSNFPPLVSAAWGVRDDDISVRIFHGGGNGCWSVTSEGLSKYQHIVGVTLQEQLLLITEE